MIGPAVELERVIGLYLSEVKYHEDTDWMTLVFSDDTTAYEWSIKLDAATSLRHLEPTQQDDE